MPAQRSFQGGHPPDIVYHPADVAHVDAYLQRGALERDEGSILLYENEEQAWRKAHQQFDSPRVLCVDTSRARRQKVRFDRDPATGLYQVDSCPIRHALNLHPDFKDQHSAGGIPVVRGEDGVARFALIQVTRRSGTTWEVAKGKHEPGETPEKAAIREVQEEMGIDVDLQVREFVAHIRYGFFTPERAPRLKNVFLYLLEPTEPIQGAFRPATREGIGAVKWFTPDEAVRVVRHPSLLPAMQRARELVACSFLPTR
jgi:8-oxo-dGTP pyrophosphatase MutT (NUDIX family)